MEDKKLFEALDGLMAYDTGATDSGIKDEGLRLEVVKYLNDLDESEFNQKISTFARKFLTNEAIEKGYGIEDVSNFINWLSDEMGIDI